MTSSNKPPREARLEANPRYYALNAHPSFRDFGLPEWVDAQGRWYRATPGVPATPGSPPPRGPAGLGYIQLNVKLPRPSVPWFPASGPLGSVQLTSTDGRHRQRNVTLVNAYMMQPQHRTGHVHIHLYEWGE